MYIIQVDVYVETGEKNSIEQNKESSAEEFTGAPFHLAASVATSDHLSFYLFSLCCL